MYEDDRLIFENNLPKLITKSEIENVLKRIERKTRIDIWFRDDDIRGVDSNLRDLLDYFESRNISLLLAVIPHNINLDRHEELLNNSNILIGQHGYSHTNHNHSGLPKSELCNCRNISTIISELMMGRERLREIFGNKFINMLIPPFFEMDEDIAVAIEPLEYGIYSTWWKNNIRQSGILELNCQIDFINWEMPFVYCGDSFIERQLFRELIVLETKKSMYHSIGIVLHHDYLCEEWMKELDWICSLEKKYSNVNLSNIKDIAKYIIENECTLV